MQMYQSRVKMMLFFSQTTLRIKLPHSCLAEIKKNDFIFKKINTFIKYFSLAHNIKINASKAKWTNRNCTDPFCMKDGSHSGNIGVAI